MPTLNYGDSALNSPALLGVKCTVAEIRGHSGHTFLPTLRGRWREALEEGLHPQTQRRAGFAERTPHLSESVSTVLAALSRKGRGHNY